MSVWFQYDGESTKNFVREIRSPFNRGLLNRRFTVRDLTFSNAASHPQHLDVGFFLLPLRINND